MNTKILIFSATYNESENIKIFLDKIFSNKIDLDVLIVDDGSPDGTTLAPRASGTTARCCTAAQEAHRRRRGRWGCAMPAAASAWAALAALAVALALATSAVLSPSAPIGALHLLDPSRPPSSQASTASRSTTRRARQRRVGVVRHRRLGASRPWA